MSEIVDRVRKFVEEETKKPGSKYKGSYDEHFVPMVKYTKLLSEKLGLSEDEMEIVEVTAWLHDIGSIIYGRENHHITSMEIAEKKLTEEGYDVEKIKKVKEAIYSHRGSLDIKPKTKEAEIIKDADAMAHFDSINGLFKSAFIEEELDVFDAEKYVKEKLKRTWNKLSDESKKSIQDKYDAAMLLLK